MFEVPYVRTYLTLVQHNGRAVFVLQDRLCSPHNPIGIDLFIINLIMAQDSYMCARDQYILDSIN